MLYDVSHPHDLRVALGKPRMTTAEIDAFLDDPDSDPELKRRLLIDAQAQGYPGPTSTGHGPSDPGEQ